MADEIDKTDERNAILEEARMHQIQRRAVLEPGEPGECQLCGEDSPRLVRGACARCRDKRKLP
jgi:hypothetical protein